jgi:hypothetical protein
MTCLITFLYFQKSNLQYLINSRLLKALNFENLGRPETSIIFDRNKLTTNDRC